MDRQVRPNCYIVPGKAIYGGFANARALALAEIWRNGERNAPSLPLSLSFLLFLVFLLYAACAARISSEFRDAAGK